MKKGSIVMVWYGTSRKGEEEEEVEDYVIRVW
jgi:hypothetical protein